MTYDYDKLYGEARDALGTPTRVFVDFFDRYDKCPARVLDIGCGQGRDALFIARLGHVVVGVDIAPNVIRDLMDAACAEELAITAAVADISTYLPDGRFDVILIDRTLHMLARDARLAALAKLLDHVRPDGWLLIADEPSNLPDIERVISSHTARWSPELRKRGVLFLKRQA